MNRITLYIWQSILFAMLLVMTLFIGLELIFSLVNELRHVGTGNYELKEAFLFILFSLPQHIVQLFPMASLVGTLLGLGLLASRSELIILRAAGMSIGDIIAAVLKLALLLAVFVWVLGEWISPMSEKFAHDRKALSLSAGLAIRTNHGTWMRDGNDFIHIHAMGNDGHLEGITLYHFDDNLHLQKASIAQHADYENDHWVLNNIEETHFNENSTTREKIAKLNWVSNLSPQVLSLVGVKDLESLSLQGLWQALQYRQQNQLDAKPYQLAFWQKLIRPFALLVMMFIAIPFVFGPLRSATMGLRMLVGVLAGFIFYTVNQLFGPLTLVYPMPPILGACLPTMLFLLIGFLFLKKVQ